MVERDGSSHYDPKVYQTLVISSVESVSSGCWVSSITFGVVKNQIYYRTYYLPPRVRGSPMDFFDSLCWISKPLYFKTHSLILVALRHLFFQDNLFRVSERRKVYKKTPCY